MSQPERANKKPSHDPVMEVLQPALKVGTLTGIGGFLVGGTAGILKNSSTPKLFATASGIQCAILGSTYWASRGFVLQAWDTGKQPISPSDRTKASAVAGGLTGGIVGAITRGRSNAIPGALGIALFGAIGQATANWWYSNSAKTIPADPQPSFWSRMIPMKHMTNAEYSEMLKEKLLKVQVEIAILDDKIAALKQNSDAPQVSEAGTETDRWG